MKMILNIFGPGLLVAVISLFGSSAWATALEKPSSPVDQYFSSQKSGAEKLLKFKLESLKSERELIDLSKEVDAQLKREFPAQYAEMQKRFQAERDSVIVGIVEAATENGLAFTLKTRDFFVEPVMALGPEDSSFLASTFYSFRGREFISATIKPEEGEEESVSCNFEIGAFHLEASEKQGEAARLSFPIPQAQNSYDVRCITVSGDEIDITLTIANPDYKNDKQTIPADENTI